MKIKLLPRKYHMCCSHFVRENQTDVIVYGGNKRRKNKFERNVMTDMIIFRFGMCHACGVVYTSPPLMCACIGLSSCRRALLVKNVPRLGYLHFIIHGKVSGHGERVILFTIIKWHISYIHDVYSYIAMRIIKTRLTVICEYIVSGNPNYM